MASRENYRTGTLNLTLERHEASLDPSATVSQKPRFDCLCRDGCRNYGRKYSCPPNSPEFHDYLCRGHDRPRVICYRVRLDELSGLAPYMRVKAAYAVLRGRLLRELWPFHLAGHRVLGSGACRACRVCGLVEGSGCKKPEKRIYSPESVGVDVDDLVIRLFGFHLQWYRPVNHVPEYLCAVGMVEGRNREPQAIRSNSRVLEAPLHGTSATTASTVVEQHPLGA